VVGPGARVLHGQWSSPSVGVVNGRTLVFFGGGDGWLYALEAATGREIWRFDGNPGDAVWRWSVDVRGITTRNSIIACPVFHQGRIYLAMGQDPEHGHGQGRLHAIDAGGSGYVTASHGVWEYTDIGRTIASPVIVGELLFAADSRGVVHCVEVATGRRIWAHDLLAPVWGSLLAASGRIYVGDEDGHVTVFAVSRVKRIISTVTMDASVWSAPAVCRGVLYVATAKRLFAIGN
jgi:outer membrane protein assembly factor BamB